MKYFLLNIIRLYWFLVPPKKRRKCIFKKSCSHHIYDTTNNLGVMMGLKEFKFRFQNCNSDFDIFIDFSTGQKKMILKSGAIINEEEIADRLK